MLRGITVVIATRVFSIYVTCNRSVRNAIIISGNAKPKVTPFQTIKLTCALESEVQTLKATVSQHEEDSNRELFPVP